MPEELQVPLEGTSTDGASTGAAPATDDLVAQDPSVAVGIDPEALPEDVTAAHEEIRGLRSVKGKLGQELGQARQEAERERQERQRIEQELATLRVQQTAPTPAPAPAPDPQKERVDAIRAEATDRYQVELQIATDEAEAIGLQDEEAQNYAQKVASRRAWHEAERSYERDQAVKRQVDTSNQAILTAMQRQLAPLLAEQELGRVIAPYAERGVSRTDLDATLKDLGVTAEQVAEFPPEFRGKFLEKMVQATAFTKGSVTPPARTVARATAQTPVSTGPGPAPTTGAPDREVLDLAAEYRRHGWYDKMPEKDATAAALAAAREALGR